MSKLILIDGNAILHRAYHALPPLTTKRGEPINAVYGFISMLLRIIQDLKPTHIAVAFDRKEPTFRHVVFEKYQVQRPEMDKELSGQFEKARDVISAFGIPIYDKAGYEADDVLGSIAEQAQSKAKLKTSSAKLKAQNQNIKEIIIVTGDRDILQLVTDKVKVYMPIKGLKDTQLMGEEEVVEKMGVAPEQIADYKALVGDPSDNYPGVSGIGPKTAATLLQRYRTVEQIYKDLGKIEEKVRNKLKEHKKDVELYRKLARIVTDVDLQVDYDAMSKWKIDSIKVLDLFSEFGFKTLTERVKKVGKEIDEEKQMTLLV